MVIMSTTLRQDIQSGASKLPTGISPNGPRLGIWNWLRSTAPTTVVMAVLVALALWGHTSDWKMPKFSSLFGASAEKASDWCDEHNVPESMCVECNKALLPLGTDYGWCAVHGVMQCPLEHPDVAQLKPQPTI